jgi:hypothetical protein
MLIAAICSTVIEFRADARRRRRSGQSTRRQFGDGRGAVDALNGHVVAGVGMVEDRVERVADVTARPAGQRDHRLLVGQRPARAVLDSDGTLRSIQEPAVAFRGLGQQIEELALLLHPQVGGADVPARVIADGQVRLVAQTQASLERVLLDPPEDVDERDVRVPHAGHDCQVTEGDIVVAAGRVDPQ